MPTSPIIVTEGHPTLRKKSSPVSENEIGSHRIRSLLKTMRRAMATAKGIGIAAPQIGISLRMFLVVDFPHGDSAETQPDAKKPSHPLVYINPTIIQLTGMLVEREEGCLSVPGLFGIVPRREGVVLEATDEKGRRFRVTADGLLAHIYQHEMDHLSGTLFLDKAIRTFSPEERGNHVPRAK
ncbi:MAG: peptide deformylase [Parcubacteria group bacterium]|nr:peptide deformylase [Parcubacteria group bacterium]